METTPDTRYSLIARLRNPHDVEAWGEFASIYQPLIHRLVTERGLQYADATDVTQEVLARVARAVEQFDADHQNVTFRGWLYRITRNLTIDFLRHQNRRKLQRIEGAAIDWNAIPEPSADESAEFRSQYERQLFISVAQSIQRQVRPHTWNAFWATEILRQSVEETARQLGLTVGSVYVARSRMIARLKSEIQKRLAETSDAAANLPPSTGIVLDNSEYYFDEDDR